MCHRSLSSPIRAGLGSLCDPARAHRARLAVDPAYERRTSLGGGRAHTTCARSPCCAVASRPWPAPDRGACATALCRARFALGSDRFATRPALIAPDWPWILHTSDGRRSAVGGPTPPAHAPRAARWRRDRGPRLTAAHVPPLFVEPDSRWARIALRPGPRSSRPTGRGSCIRATDVARRWEGPHHLRT